MKNILIGLALFSIAFNVYFHGTWIYAFVNTETHAGAVSMSQGFFPSFLSVKPQYGIGLMLTLISIIALSKFITAHNQYLYIIGIGVQVTFIGLYIWQLL